MTKTKTISLPTDTALHYWRYYAFIYSEPKYSIPTRKSRYLFSKRIFLHQILLVYLACIYFV